MQATLIYNQNSGGADSVSAEDLQDALREAGYQPNYQETSSEEDLDPIIEQARGLVVVAGGDGSVRAVATRLIDKDASLAIIPLGTANNIGKTLGVEGKPRDIIARLAEPRRQPFDMGRVRAPWGEDYFLEATGYGLYADALASYQPDEGKSVPRALSTLSKMMANYQPHDFQVSLDGKDISGCYLLLEVLNTSATGPRLVLAPDADPGDGLLDIVRIHEDHRNGLMKYVTGLLSETLDDLPSVEVTRGRKLELSWHGFPMHIDGEVRRRPNADAEDQDPAQGADTAGEEVSEGRITIEIIPGALELYLPQSDKGSDEQ